MTRLTLLAIGLFIVAASVRIAHADESRTMDLAARPNQLPKGYAEYGLLLAMPAGPERDPPVDQWKYAGVGSWITATIYAQVGVTDRIEVDGWATLAIGHPENTPGARPNRFGGLHLDGTYKVNKIASATAGISYLDPWLALYGHTTFQHYFRGSEAKLAGHLGGRFGKTIAKRWRVQALPKLTIVPNAVDAPSNTETWILAELMVKANTRLFSDFFAGVRTGLRTGNNLSVSATDGATLPVIVELRYIAQQMDLGLDIGFGSLLTSTTFPSQVAYAEIPSSIYLGAVLNWRLD